MPSFGDALRQIISEENKERFLIVKSMNDMVYYYRRGTKNSKSPTNVKIFWVTNRKEAYLFPTRDVAQEFAESCNIKDYAIMLKVVG